MTKTEQIRLKTWRLKVLQYAAERPRNMARTCRRSGISRRAWAARHTVSDTIRNVRTRP